MKLFDLLSTCQNQWYGIRSMKYNPLFNVKLVFDIKSDNVLEEDYLLKHDYFDDVNYLIKYRDRVVKWWRFEGRHDLIICIDGSF